MLAVSTVDPVIAGIVFLIGVVVFVIAAYIFGKANLPMALIAIGLALGWSIFMWYWFAQA